MEKLRRLGFWELESILGFGDNWLWDTYEGGHSKNKPMKVRLLVLDTPSLERSGQMEVLAISDGSFGYQCSSEQSFMHRSLLLMPD